MNQTDITDSYRENVEKLIIRSLGHHVAVLGIAEYEFLWT